LLWQIRLRRSQSRSRVFGVLRRALLFTQMLRKSCTTKSTEPNCLNTRKAGLLLGSKTKIRKRDKISQNTCRPNQYEFFGDYILFRDAEHYGINYSPGINYTYSGTGTNSNSIRFRNRVPGNESTQIRMKLIAIPTHSGILGIASDTGIAFCPHLHTSYYNR
jgi:hypothetical protein